MKKVWKRNLLAGAVLVTVCGGIYLNWIYATDVGGKDLTDTLNAQKVMSEDMLVMGEELDLQDTDTITDYFASVRLSRQQARDSAVSVLQEAMAYADQRPVDRTSSWNRSFRRHCVRLKSKAWLLPRVMQIAWPI